MGIGALVLAVSTILPWYTDRDVYQIVDQFYGITGPAWLIGSAILVFACLSFWLFSYHLLQRRMPRLPVREPIFHMFVAIESLFLLILVNSIFFHQKFGVYITLKESGFGTVLAFVGASLLGIGAYLKNAEDSRVSASSGRLEPLIKMDEAQVSRTHGDITAAPTVPSPRAFTSPTEKPRTSGGGSFKIRMDL